MYVDVHRCMRMIYRYMCRTLAEEARSWSRLFQTYGAGPSLSPTGSSRGSIHQYYARITKENQELTGDFSNKRALTTNPEVVGSQT